MKPQTQDLVTNGRFNFGRYHAPFAAVNPLDAQPYRLPLVRAARDFRLKEWQAFQFANDRFFANVALFNAKLMGLVQVKIFDRETGTKHLFERQVPPWSFRAPPQLLNSCMEYAGRGCVVRFDNQLERDWIDIEFDVPRTGKCPAIQGRLRALCAGQTPLVVAIPFGENRGMYSHKGLVPLEGTLTVGAETSTFERGTGYLLMDDHRGYYPWVMEWDWLTTARYNDDGRLFGFNLTRNASIDPGRFNENAFWLDGDVHPLPPVTFARSGEGAAEVWRIRDAHGRVEVDFHVEIPGRVDINALVVRSKYRGPFGTCRGTVTGEDGTSHAVDGMFGMAEEFYLRV